MPAAGHAFARRGVDTWTGDVAGGFIEEPRFADASDTPPRNQTICVVTTLLFACDGALFTRGGIVPSTVADAVVGGPTCAVAIAGDAGTVAAQVEGVAVER